MFYSVVTFYTRLIHFLFSFQNKSPLSVDRNICELSFIVKYIAGQCLLAY